MTFTLVNPGIIPGWRKLIFNQLPVSISIDMFIDDLQELSRMLKEAGS